MYVSHGIALT